MGNSWQKYFQLFQNASERARMTGEQLILITFNNTRYISPDMFHLQANINVQHLFISLRTLISLNLIQAFCQQFTLQSVGSDGSSLHFVAPLHFLLFAQPFDATSQGFNGFTIFPWFATARRYSSTLHPYQWVSGWVVVSTSVASRLASLFLPKLLKWCYKVSWGGKMTTTQSSTIAFSVKRLKE